MKVTSLLSDDAILGELGRRIQRARLAANVTQASLAEQAGVSLPTVQRIEAGASTQMVSMIRVLRAMNLADRLDLLIDPPGIRPVDMVERAGRARQRASATTESASAHPWTWGDER